MTAKDSSRADGDAASQVECDEASTSPGLSRIDPPIGPSPDRLSAPPSWTVLTALALGLLVYFGVLSYARVTDLDEGYYVLASKLVFQGKVVYRDFFFSQTPLYPYFCGLWLKLTGYSWYSARFFGALLSTAAGLLFYSYVFWRYRSRQLALGLTLAFAGSSLVAEWYVLAKTYAITCLGLLLVFCLLEWAQQLARSDWRLYAAAGVLAGLCIDVRLMLLVPLAFLALSCGRRGLWPSVLGCLVGLQPCLYFFYQSPENFIFGNFGVHGIRSSSGLIGDLQQKVTILLSMLGLGYVSGGLNFQVVLGLPVLVFALVQRQVHWRPLLVALAICGVSFLPTPTFLQYFCVAVPFFLLALAPWLARQLETPSAARSLTGLLGLYLLATPVGLFYWCGLTTPYWQPMAGADRRRISTLREVSQQIGLNSRPGDQVYSSWPGYLLETDSRAPLGTENNFPHELDLFVKLGAEKSHKYAMATDQDVESMLASGTIPLVVLGLGFRDEEVKRARHLLLLQSGYRVVWSKDEILIYRKNPSPRA